LDLYGERKIGELLTKLSEIDKIQWIRIHYAYPTNFPSDLIDIIKENPKICKYIDIPFQHITNNMLNKMRRGIDKDETLALINELRTKIPNIAIRTTLLVGHPGETEKDFKELLDFVKATKFDRLGVFIYSEEEDTFSAKKYKDEIPLQIKEERLAQVMSLQNTISNNLNYNKIGHEFRVIIDRIENDYIIGRTEFDSPEVDQEVLISKPDFKIKTGDFLNIRITSNDEYDLYGEILK